MAFSGLDGLIGSSTRKNSDDSFTLKIDRGLISFTNQGEFSLEVVLGDSISTKGSTQRISVKVIFVQ